MIPKFWLYKPAKYFFNIQLQKMFKHLFIQNYYDTNNVV